MDERLNQRVGLTIDGQPQVTGQARELEGRRVNRIFVPVVCTDKGQHLRVRLATVNWWEDGSWHMTLEPSWQPPNADAEAAASGSGTTVSRTSYGFYCLRCGRNPQITRARWLAGCDRYRDAFLTEMTHAEKNDGVDVVLADLDLSLVLF